jgi:hypothetical protein
MSELRLRGSGSERNIYGSTTPPVEGEAHRFDEAGDESTHGGDLVLQVGAVLGQLLQLLVLFLINSSK